jgi:hypothetical protein
MMLKGQPGSTATGCGSAPAGASQRSSGCRPRHRPAQCAAPIPARAAHGVGRAGVEEEPPGRRRRPACARRPRRAARRQRRHHHASAQRAQVDGGVVDGGGGAEGDGVPGLQAVALQRGGDPVHAGVEQGPTLRRGASVLANQVGDRAESGWVRSRCGVHGGRRGWVGRIIGNAVPCGRPAGDFRTQIGRFPACDGRKQLSNQEL